MVGGRILFIQMQIAEIGEVALVGAQGGGGVTSTCDSIKHLH